MIALDLRGTSPAQAVMAIATQYNSSVLGDRFEVLLGVLETSLRVSLLEAGARYGAVRQGDGSWRLTIIREHVPAQGTVPGLHHLVCGEDGSVWVAQRASRVARIDSRTGQIAKVREVARKASHLALDERAGRLFVADPEVGEMIALRAVDLAELARWVAPGAPQLPLVSPDGIVCVTGGASGTVTIAWPRNAAYRTATFEVGASPHDACLDRHGEHLFVPCAGGTEIVKLRLADGAVVGRVQVGEGPSHLVLHPDGTRLYSANSWDGSVSCVTVDGEAVGQAASGGWAHSIEIAPDGRWIYVANFMEDTVAVFDAQTLDRVALLETDRYPHGLDVSPDGKHLVATGFGSDHARVYDARLHRELARVDVGWGSSHTDFAPDGAAWIGCSVGDHVACIDLQTLACVSRVRLTGAGLLGGG
jgi:DNA-binding beta-propeller fold protein YncE